jgi:hypothetical protein
MVGEGRPPYGCRLNAWVGTPCPPEYAGYAGSACSTSN